MKVEIDISDRASLVRQKAELERYLKVIDFALNDMNGGRPPVPSTNGELPLATNGYASIARRVLNIVQGLPRRFTTSDVMISMGADAKANRTAIKLTLGREVVNENIRVLSAGAGRRATQYEKTSQE